MQFNVTVNWHRGGGAFDTKTFSRDHTVEFGSGVSIRSSSAPDFAGNMDLPNPEELFVSAISSCFMLTFLYYAALKGIVIDEYTSSAVGILAKNNLGKMAMTEVTIHPKITYGDNKKPDATTIEELYEKAHANCFISNSVSTKVTIS